MAKFYLRVFPWIMSALALSIIVYSVYVAEQLSPLTEITTGKIVAPVTPMSEIVHMHTDFKVYLNGKEMDFRKPEYNVKHQWIHLHVENDNGGNVIHVESEKATLGFFFESLGMNFNYNCFVISHIGYCSNETYRLRFFVNGVENFEYGNYIPKDLDRILITYGNEPDEDIQNQIDSVTDDACIYSDKCPERVREPPPGTDISI